MLEAMGIITDSIRFLEMEGAICQVFFGWCGAMLIGLWGLGSVLNGDTKLTKFETVLMVIRFVLAIILAFVGVVPAFILVMLFQWGPLLLCIFYAALAGAASYFLSGWIARVGRRGKYKNNPIVKEVLAFCKANQVMAVQCFRHEVRFFSDIPDPDYCKYYNNDIKAYSAADSAQKQNAWVRPASWTASDRPECYLGTIRFADRGYENLPDVKIFAETLAHKLHGFSIAEHTQSVSYETKQYEAGTTTITTHRTIIYQDCYLYHKNRFRMKKDEMEEKKKKEDIQEYQFKAPGKKSWE